MDIPSTKPYLLRALWEWCTDTGLTPFVVVIVDEHTRVPREFVREGQIVLNLGAEATHRLQMGNDLIEFQARFGGVARELSIPVSQVAAIYARETGAGMTFEVGADSRDPLAIDSSPPTLGQRQDPPPSNPPSPPEGGRPRLQRIK